MPEQHNSWRGVGVSVRGLSHVKSDLPCQDYAQWLSAGDGFFIGAVADGAGSAKESERGAKVACSAAISFLEKELPTLKTPDEDKAKDLCHEALTRARESIFAEAASSKTSVRE